VLFKRHDLDGLADGSISVAFRRWARPRVRAGSHLRTAVGVLAVDAVDELDIDDITEDDARRAGFASLSDLLENLATQRDGRVYRVLLRVAGPDPRVTLRGRDTLTGDELAEVERRLARLDAASRHGAWTLTVLRLIRDRPAVRAGDLARRWGRTRSRSSVMSASSTSSGSPRASRSATGCRRAAARCSTISGSERPELARFSAA
jgi:hypothetical protein